VEPLAEGQSVEGWFPLTDNDGRPLKQKSMIHVRLRYVSVKNVSAKQRRRERIKELQRQKRS
jgi:hypothetical protein